MSEVAQGGVVAIWNGIADEAHDEFYRWHETEHMPERLAIPGFLRGRRYRAVGEGIEFFTRYDVESPDVLTSEAYLARLNAPTDWTRRVLPHFRNTSRALCKSLLASAKHSQPWLGTLKLFGRSDEPLPRLRHAVASLYPGTSIQLLETNHGASAVVTAERESRGRDDLAPDWIVLLEARSLEALDETSHRVALSLSLPEPDIRRYCLECDLLSL